MSYLHRRLLRSCAMSPTRRLLSYSLPTPRKLGEITDVSKLSREDPGSIELIWTARHQDAPSACSAILRQAALVEQFQDRAKRCPHFVFPVFNGENYFMMYSQFQESHFMMTYLDDFRRDPTAASPWFSIVVYPDLVRDKDLALVRGDFLPNLQKQEAEALLGMAMDAYVTSKPISGFLESFNHSPGQFDFERYIGLCRSEHLSRCAEQGNKE